LFGLLLGKAMFTHDCRNGAGDVGIAEYLA
jgi:hypothetical protein